MRGFEKEESKKRRKKEIRKNSNSWTGEKRTG